MISTYSRTGMVEVDDVTGTAVRKESKPDKSRFIKGEQENHKTTEVHKHTQIQQDQPCTD